MRLLPSRVCCVVGLCLMVAFPIRGFAQTSTAQTGLAPRELMVRFTSSAGTGTGVPNIGEALADLIALEIASAPLGPGAGRGVTLGAGRATVGVTYIRASYDRFDNIDIRDGSLLTAALYVANAPVYTGALQFAVTTDTAVMFANVALNSRFDVGVAVPYVHLTIEGVHQVGDSVTEGTASVMGLGDIALRGKLRVYTRDQNNVAIGVEARLPTGDKQALLGAGATRTLVSGIWSSTRGRLTPRASAGFEYWADPFRAYDPLARGDIDAGRHALAYSAGVEWTHSARLTLNADVTGRDLVNGGHLSYRAIPFRGNPFGISSASIATVDPRGLQQLTGVFGVKWNVENAAVLTANVLTPLNSAGLRDRITPMVGIEWGF